MSADEQLRFSLRADVPKENIQVLDNVLNELFGTLSSKMKAAGEFLESVKMRPPRNSLETNEDEVNSENEANAENDEEEVNLENDEVNSEFGEEEETDSDMPDLVTDSDTDIEEDSDVECDADDESEIDHIFLILIDGKTVGYSPTLRGAMQAVDEVYGEFTATHQGSFRLEQTPTSLRIYRRTPYVWFMFSEQLALQVDIQVVARV
jgi:hypothetical protein